MTWYVDHSCNIGSTTNAACKNSSIRRGLAYHRKVYRQLETWVGQHPDQQLHIEPWLRHSVTRQLRQPDAVLVDTASETAVVIEVKMNWKDGRDEKLLKEYLAAAQEAFNLQATWPCVITSNLRGLKYAPLLGLTKLLLVDDWTPEQPTPVLLLP